MNRFTRFVTRAPIGLYRAGLLPKSLLLLEHTGRRSGLARSTLLGVVEFDDSGAPVVVSGDGERSDWFRNVSADPKVTYRIGRRRTLATAERLDHAEAMATLERYRANHRRPAEMMARRLGVSLTEDLDRAAARIPLFRLVPR